MASVEPLPGTAGAPEAVATPVPLPPVSGTDNSQALAGPQPCIIDLPAAWRLADVENPDIGISRQAILESLALEQGARVLLLPSIQGGTNYHDHNGNLQRSRGAILDVPAEQALYFGAGARTVAAESVAFPGIRIFSHLGDAYFEPRAAAQQVEARRFDAGAMNNDILLRVSTQYFSLMGAEADLVVLKASLNDATAISRMTSDFARIGQARQADADRMTTEARLLDSEVQRASGHVAVVAAQLARLLNLDPSLRLQTVGGPIPILELVDSGMRLESLVQIAERQRPELAARNFEVSEMQYRYRQERTRAWLPTVAVGFSAGSFGGGSNLVDPVFGRFAGRTDFDALAYWSAQNFGVGNVARWRQRRAQTDQAIATRARTLNRVRSEVAQAYAESAAQRQSITISERRLAEAEQGYSEEFTRIRGGEGLPIELLDNLTRLISARRMMVQAVTTYDQAQFRLFVALGQPPTFVLQNAETAGALKATQP